MLAKQSPALQGNILALDTDQSTRRGRRAALENAGLSVVDATTCNEALGIACVELPSAALLSTRSVGPAAFALCRELKRHPRTAGLPVLILADSADSYPEALEAGADAFLQEPVDTELLLKTVRVLLSRRGPGDGLGSQWRALADAVPAILCRNRADGLCDYCNRRAYEFTGMPEGSLEGLNWIELVHPEDRSRVRGTWLAGMRTGAPFLAEYRLRRADGEFRWFHSHVVPIVDSRNGSVEWFGVSSDIHESHALRVALEQIAAARTAQVERTNANLLAEIRERERIEEMLGESEERFHSLFDNATVGLYRTTPDGRILMANPALVAMLGFDSFEELERRNLNEEGAGAGYDRASFRRMLESEGTIRGLETTWTRRDGTPVFLRENAMALRGPDGVVRFYDGIIEDVTSRKEAEDTLRESEERFRAIFDQASVGIVQGTMDGHYTAVNDRYCEITGYSRAELLTMRFQDITHPGDLGINLEYARKLVAGELREFTVEKRYLRKDGATIWVKTFGTLATQRDGAGLFVGVAEDISERKRAEEELQQQLEFDRVTADLLTYFATCSGSEIDKAIVESLRVAAGHCEADHALIFLRTGEGGVVRCTGEWCGPGISAHAGRLQSVQATAFPWIARKIYALEDTVVQSLDDLPPEAAAERDWLAAEGARALLQMPIEGRIGRSEGAIGSIVLHRHQNSQPWTRRDQTRLRVVANAIAALLERKQAEERLRQSEEKFSLMFYSSPEAILITSVSDQKITDANPSFVEISGYSREEAIGKSTVELGMVVNPEARAELWAHLLKEHVLVDYDIALRTKSGDVRSGLLSSVMVTVQERQYLISMFRDLTERRMAQDELQRQAAFDNLMTSMLSEFVRRQASELSLAVDEALERIAAFFSADHALLFDVSPETHTWGITREWNAPHVLPIRGNQAHGFWSSERFFSDTDINMEVAEAGAEAGVDPEAYRQEGATVVLNVPIKGSAGLVSGRIGLHRHGDRTPWTPEDSSRLRVAGNAIGGALQRTRAEASLRESERRFRDLADSAPMLTFSSGPDRSGVFYNKQAIEFSGRSLAELIGNGWMELVHPEDRERYIATCFGAADAHQAFSTEARFRRADGEYRWILVTAVPRIVDEVYQGHIGTGIDVTDLKRTFEQHLASQKLESLGVLAAGVAHDFNNLLGAIVARAESAQEDLIPGSSPAEDVEQIHVTALRAAEIVSQLMSFARQESAPLAAVDLSRLVAETLALLKLSIAKTATLKTELAANLPPVPVNSAEIRQVVMNLVINASEALEGKAGVITITTASAPPGEGSGGAVLLEVADSGCGMDEDVKARIFDPFFTTRFAGRGLGLSAVQGIVRRHGGSIRVESSPGLGSRFTITLPEAAG